MLLQDLRRWSIGRASIVVDLDRARKSVESRLHRRRKKGAARDTRYSIPTSNSHLKQHPVQSSCCHLALFRSCALLRCFRYQSRSGGLLKMNLHRTEKLELRDTDATSTVIGQDKTAQYTSLSSVYSTPAQTSVTRE